LGWARLTRPLTEEDRAAFRDRMCDVAESRFARHGYQAVTMRDLAAGMGVSSMTPYRYFKDKDQILAAVRTRAFTRLADAMDAAEDRLRGSDWIQPGEAYFNWALANRDAYRLMFIEQPTTPQFPELLAAMHRARETMNAGWRRLQAAGRFNGNVEDAAHMCWTATHGVLVLELSGMLRPPVEARTIAMRSVEAIARGLNVPTHQAAG
jgi:AcrR family transcriptional regulator